MASSPGGSDGSFDSAGNSAIFGSAKMEPSSKIGSSPVHSCSGSLTEWISPLQGHSTYRADTKGVSKNPSSYTQDDNKEYQFDLPNRSAAFSFSAGDPNHVSDIRGSLDSSHLMGEAEFRSTHLGGTNSNCM